MLRGCLGQDSNEGMSAACCVYITAKSSGMCTVREFPGANACSTCGTLQCMSVLQVRPLELARYSGVGYAGRSS